MTTPMTKSTKRSVKAWVKLENDGTIDLDSYALTFPTLREAREWKGYKHTFVRATITYTVPTKGKAV